MRKNNIRRKTIINTEEGEMDVLRIKQQKIEYTDKEEKQIWKSVARAIKFEAEENTDTLTGNTDNCASTRICGNVKR